MNRWEIIKFLFYYTVKYFSTFFHLEKGFYNDLFILH